MSEANVQRMADPADLAWHHKERWSQRMAELRRAAHDAPDEEARARAKQAMQDHYAERGNVEPTRAAMMRAVAAKMPTLPSPEELDRIAREAVEGWRQANPISTWNDQADKQLASY